VREALHAAGQLAPFEGLAPGAVGAGAITRFSGQ